MLLARGCRIQQFKSSTRQVRIAREPRLELLEDRLALASNLTPQWEVAPLAAIFRQAFAPTAAIILSSVDPSNADVMNQGAAAPDNSGSFQANSTLSFTLSAAAPRPLGVVVPLTNTFGPMVELQATVVWEDGQLSQAQVVKNDAGASLLVAIHPGPPGERKQDKVEVQITTKINLAGLGLPTQLDGLVGVTTAFDARLTQFLHGLFGPVLLVQPAPISPSGGSSGPPGSSPASGQQGQGTPAPSPQEIASIVFRLAPMNSTTGQMEWTGTGPHTLPQGGASSLTEEKTTGGTRIVPVPQDRIAASFRPIQSGTAQQDRPSDPNAPAVARPEESVSKLEEDQPLAAPEVARFFSAPEADEWSYPVAMQFDWIGAWPSLTAGSAGSDQLEIAAARAYVARLLSNSSADLDTGASRSGSAGAKNEHFPSRKLAAYLLPWVFSAGTGFLIYQVRNKEKGR